MRQKPLKQPKARNNAAFASLQGYFDRISHSLEDRVSEYVQMNKYVRVYEESQKLLDIQKTINISAGSIFEINLDKRLDVSATHQLVQTLHKKNKALRSFMQNKPLTTQLKLLDQVSRGLHNVTVNLLQIQKDIARVNEVIPVIKAILKVKDKEGHHENDPLLIEINNALTNNITEPNLTEIKAILKQDYLNFSQYDARLAYEDFNDVSDKLIGLLNDKLLLIIGISEFLIAGVEDDGANDVGAKDRLPDELRVLFLGSSVLDILHKVKQIRGCIRNILTNIKLCVQIIDSDRLESKFKALLKNGEDNLYEMLALTTPRLLQRVRKAIVEISPGLDALDLKLKLDTLDLTTVMNMTYGLIYEKSNRTWENPYYS